MQFQSPVELSLPDLQTIKDKISTEFREIQTQIGPQVGNRHQQNGGVERKREKTVLSSDEFRANFKVLDGMTRIVLFMGCFEWNHQSLYHFVVGPFAFSPYQHTHIYTHIHDIYMCVYMLILTNFPPFPSPSFLHLSTNYLTNTFSYTLIQLPSGEKESKLWRKTEDKSDRSNDSLNHLSPSDLLQSIVEEQPAGMIRIPTAEDSDSVKRVALTPARLLWKKSIITTAPQVIFCSSIHKIYQ